MKSSSAKPNTAAGRHPMTTMPQRRHVLRRSSTVLLGEKGLSLWKYRIMTAMMAPIWITTKNSARNESETCSFTNSSTRIMWPVEEIGSHSVMPSTRPMSSAFKASISMGAKPSAFMCIYATVEFYMTGARSLYKARALPWKNRTRALLWQTVRKSKKRHPSSSGPKSCL